MSILMRAPNGTLKLFTKGADDVILARLASDQPVEMTSAHLETLSSLGLRTLCVAEKEISSKDYQEWLIRFQEANTALEDRERKLSEVYDLLERELVLLGVSAIEDKLQENVPETIADLRRAGLRVWMLTGDKFATAVQISTTCNLISGGRGNCSSCHSLEIPTVCFRYEVIRWLTWNKKWHNCSSLFNNESFERF